jgi:hypothetical protein
MILEAVLRTMEGVSRECGPSAVVRYSVSVSLTHLAETMTLTPLPHRQNLGESKDPMLGWGGILNPLDQSCKKLQIRLERQIIVLN